MVLNYPFVYSIFSWYAKGIVIIFNVVYFKKSLRVTVTEF
jgi:hypothetical protein